MTWNNFFSLLYSLVFPVLEMSAVQSKGTALIIYEMEFSNAVSKKNEIRARKRPTLKTLKKPTKWKWKKNQWRFSQEIESYCWNVVALERPLHTHLLTLSFNKYNKCCLSYSGYIKVHPVFHCIFFLLMLRNFHKRRTKDFGLGEVLKKEKCMRSKKISSE